MYGALPAKCVKALQELALEVERSEGPAKEKLQRKTFAILEHYLHNSTAKKCLTEPPVAAMIRDSITHMQTSGLWDTLEYVIMPNHVHLLFALTAAPFAPRCFRLSDGPAGKRKPFCRWQRYTSGRTNPLTIGYARTPSMRGRPNISGKIPSRQDWSQTIVIGPTGRGNNTRRERPC